MMILSICGYGSGSHSGKCQKLDYSTNAVRGNELFSDEIGGNYYREHLLRIRKHSSVYERNIIDRVFALSPLLVEEYVE